MSSSACIVCNYSSATSQAFTISSSRVPSQDFKHRTFAQHACGPELPDMQASCHALELAIDSEIPPLDGLSYMLQANIKGESSGEARDMHQLLCSKGLETLLGNHLVPMFVKCGSLSHAQQAFYKVSEPNLYSWTSLINGYINSSKFQYALDLFQSMQERGMHSGSVTLLAVLRACGRLKLLERGRKTHMEIVKGGYEDETFLASTVIDMYARCGSLTEAELVFDNLLHRDVVTWNTLIAGYVDCELGSEALSYLQKMEQEGIEPDASTFVYAVKACTSLHALREGQKFHVKLIEEGFEIDSYVGNTLVDFYGKLGFFLEAQAVFNELPVQDVVPWTSLISAYADCGFNKEVLESYKQMLESNVFPNEVTHSCILRSCSAEGDLSNIHTIHSEINKKGHKGDCHLGKVLVGVYASSGCFIEAQYVFDALLSRDEVVWTALLEGYVEHGLGEVALYKLDQMFADGVSPNQVTLMCSLNACSSSRMFDAGRQVHMEILKMGYESDLSIGNALVDMYARCGSFVETRQVFESLPVQNVVTWNIMITACTESELDDEALLCTERMALEGVSLNSVTFSCTLKSCSRVGAIERGRTIHIQTVKEAIDREYTVGNTIVSLYAKCALLSDARKVLDDLPNRDVVAWTALIGGYSEHGFGEEAMQCLEEMQLEKVSPNGITLDSILKACNKMLGPMDNPRRIHAEIVKKGFCIDKSSGESLVVLYAKHRYLEEGRSVHDGLTDPGPVSSNALIEGYAKSGNFTVAKQILGNQLERDVVSWTALISGFVEREHNEQALCCFEQMQLDGVSPDAMSLAWGLQACGDLRITVEGQKLHSQIVKQGFEQDPFLCNCMLDMYAKFSCMDEARDVFERLVIRDIISWTAFTTGYAFLGLREQVFICLKQMQIEHVAPNLIFWNSIMGAFAENEEIETTYMCMLHIQEQGQLPDSWTIINALKACGKAADITSGKVLHARVSGESGTIETTCVTALIDMYGKCGSMTHAQHLFDALPSKDLATWNALIDGYSRTGASNHVFLLLESMQEARIQPNETTFLSVLMVCGHAGLLHTSQVFFEVMCKVWKIEPIMKHFNSMAVLLGRAGQLGEALGMLESMSFLPDLITWRSLLAASRLRGDIQTGIQAFNAATTWRDEFSASIVLLPNIYGEDVKYLNGLKLTKAHSTEAQA